MKNRIHKTLCRSLLLPVVLLAACTHAPDDPFSISVPPHKTPQKKEKIRRDPAEMPSQQAELIWTPHKQMPNGRVKAIFYLGTEAKRLYPDMDEKALLKMSPVPDVSIVGPRRAVRTAPTRTRGLRFK